MKKKTRENMKIINFLEKIIFNLFQKDDLLPAFW